MPDGTEDVSRLRRKNDQLNYQISYEDSDSSCHSNINDHSRKCYDREENHDHAMVNQDTATEHKHIFYNVNLYRY